MKQRRLQQTCRATRPARGTWAMPDLNTPAAAACSSSVHTASRRVQAYGSRTVLHVLVYMLVGALACQHVFGCLPMGDASICICTRLLEYELDFHRTGGGASSPCQILFYSLLNAVHVARRNMAVAAVCACNRQSNAGLAPSPVLQVPALISTDRAHLPDIC